jgi:hypothetical protein
MTERSATRVAWIGCVLSVAGGVGFLVIEFARHDYVPADWWFNAQEAIGPRRSGWSER